MSDDNDMTENANSSETVAEHCRYEVSCEREFGEWTVRMNGMFIASFVSLFLPFRAEARARRLAWNLLKAL